MKIELLGNGLSTNRWWCGGAAEEELNYLQMQIHKRKIQRVRKYFGICTKLKLAAAFALRRCFFTEL